MVGLPEADEQGLSCFTGRSVSVGICRPFLLAGWEESSYFPLGGYKLVLQRLERGAENETPPSILVFTSTFNHVCLCGPDPPSFKFSPESITCLLLELGRGIHVPT